MSKIYVAGHTGMVGSAILRQLIDAGHSNTVTVPHEDIDLREQAQVRAFMSDVKPEYVFLAAAKVGGIQANILRPADFLYDNIMIQSNVIHEAFLSGVKKILFISTSCIYPCECAQPIVEKSVLTGPLEPTNESYALAKIAGMKMIEYYREQYDFNGISAVPCNLYGTNDCFDPLLSHVLTALIKKFVDAKEQNVASITLWGSGVARREFMHVDDAARALICLMGTYDSDDFINIGCGVDVSINELALLIAEKVNYKGDILWDTTKPDGMMRKCMDVSRMQEFGFKPTIPLDVGIERTVAEYRMLKECGEIE